jgi:hypothetical protein
METMPRLISAAAFHLSSHASRCAAKRARARTHARKMIRIIRQSTDCVDMALFLTADYSVHFISSHEQLGGDLKPIHQLFD